MKAALKAWGASESNLFQQGFAKQSDDRQVIAAAMANPGVVLRRPVGSNKGFQERAELPTAESLSEHFRKTELPRKKAPAPKSPKAIEKAKRDAAEVAEREAAAKVDEKAERKAAAAYKKEERRRELKRQKEAATAAKLRSRRNAALEKAKSALDKARREHVKKTAAIEKKRAAVDRRAQQEETRWQKLERRLEEALQRAGR
ncbi:cell envelope biogenesis protein TolA [Taklimakanibacter deserti]|uniref:cell envelope biogenesis protein TolA n=1 Tax=Taklimakanibacter deserti TaxID=2267839 RepID=UPI0034D4CF38